MTEQAILPFWCRIFGHRYVDTPFPGIGKLSRGVCSRCGDVTKGCRINDPMAYYSYVAEVCDPEIARSMIRVNGMMERMHTHGRR